MIYWKLILNITMEAFRREQEEQLLGQIRQLREELRIERAGKEQLLTYVASLGLQLTYVNQSQSNSTSLD